MVRFALKMCIILYPAVFYPPRPYQVHVYELTQHDDKYDLRYRLKDKIYLPPSSSSSALTTTTSCSSGGLASLAAAASPSPEDLGGESKQQEHERSATDQLRSSSPSVHQQLSRHQSRSGGHHRRPSADSVDNDGSKGGSSRDEGGGGPEAGSTSFLLVTWNHVILCEGRVLQLYDFSGTKVKSGIWDQDAGLFGFWVPNRKDSESQMCAQG